MKLMYIVQTISTDGISEKLYQKNHKEKNLGNNVQLLIRIHSYK